jgi:8-oxo-dGTP pyrophosphatase MutT (NUDIX family)
MIPVYALDPLPTKMIRSIFLAGPTPRDKSVKSWRPHALQVLEAMGYDGHVFIPEPAGGDWKSLGYNDQIGWEEDALNQADCILFWVPRDMKTMPALTTNDEWGVWKHSEKVVFGAPDNAEHVNYQRYYADKYRVPGGDSMITTVKAAIEMVGQGALRNEGEVKIPLHIWSLSSFQGWYKVQTGAGNVLKDARVLWVSKMAKARQVFLWVVHVDVYIASEDRVKSNEFLIGRLDTSSVVLWHRAPTLTETEVVIIKEFRSPARTSDGFIREFPGGSSLTETDPKEVAVEEVQEEAAFVIEPERLVPHSFRQLFGTLSSMGAHVYSAEISDEELGFFKSQIDKPHGLEEDSERTFIEVYSVGDLLTNPLTDWATLGMLFATLSEAMR